MKNVLIILSIVCLSTCMLMGVAVGDSRVPQVERLDIAKANITANIIEEGVIMLGSVPDIAALADVECPPEGLDESEPCGEDTNGGCNSNPPIFTDIECGDTFCGEAWAEDSTRDTDWYELVLTSATTVTWTVEAEFGFLIGIVETVPPGSNDCADSTGSVNPYALGGANDVISVQAVLEPGTYWLFIASDDFVSYPCSQGPWDYVATVECEECFDNDGDGYYDETCGGSDCDDTNPEVNPGHKEVKRNGIDDDCDGKVDERCFIGIVM